MHDSLRACSQFDDLCCRRFRFDLSTGWVSGHTSTRKLNGSRHRLVPPCASIRVLRGNGFVFAAEAPSCTAGVGP